MDNICLSLRNISVNIAGTELVRGVSLDVPRGGALGLVGESGSGKTLTLRAVLGLAAMGRKDIVVTGEAWFEG